MSTATAAPATPATPVTTDPWAERIAPFAQIVGKTVEEINAALKGLVGDPSPAALAALSDPSAVLDVDLQGALVSSGPAIPLGIFRKNLAKLRGPQLTTEVAAPGSINTFEALPSVPEDASFLEMLKVGGVLKPGVTEVISALRAALANKLGLYDIQDVVLEKMESFAESQDQPVGESFYALRKLVTSRSYGDILEVLGVPGSFASATRKRDFLRKVDIVWDELRSFNTQLDAWQQAWMKGAANPGLVMAAMFAGSQAGRGAILPPGMMSPPETNGLRDAAEAVINKINKVFSGVGVPIARALAYDATRIKKFLEDPALPAAIGAANRDQMLKTLGITVGADYVRLERSVTRYTLAIMELPKVTPGNEELSYLGAMMQLGASISWDKLPSGSGSSFGGGAARLGLGRAIRNGRNVEEPVEE